jgi:hypothetical protein
MEKLDGDAPYKSCFARVFTDESISIILSGELDHIHETNAQKSLKVFTGTVKFYTERLIVIHVYR